MLVLKFLKKITGICILALSKKIYGNNNIVSSRSNHLIRSKIIIDGDNNQIFISDNCRIRDSRFYIKGNNNVIHLDSSVTMNFGDIWIEDNNSKISIGENTYFTSRFHMACMEGTAIEIGESCLIAADVIFRTGDSHSILDVETGKRVNKSANITIADKVWIGSRATVNKGVHVSANSIVASNSVVTKKFDESNVVIAGVPANIVKRGVTWEGDRI